LGLQALRIQADKKENRPAKKLRNHVFDALDVLFEGCRILLKLGSSNISVCFVFSQKQAELPYKKKGPTYF
jgi:hypothetical protein